LSAWEFRGKVRSKCALNGCRSQDVAPVFVKNRFYRTTFSSKKTPLSLAKKRLGGCFERYELFAKAFFQK
jgi:hypothetical protein